MANTDYTTTSLTIIDMVYNRLPFLAITTNNTNIIKSYVWEVMNELEGCFKVTLKEDGTIDETLLGMEDNYTPQMMSIIADLVAVYMLLLISAQNAQGSAASSTSASVRYLKKAKAGSAEVEWGELDIKKSGVLNIGGAALISKYELLAARKARNLGCILDICTDCVGLVQGPLPFITITDCGCGC